MLTVVAFVLALGLLVAIHEYGHYRVAVACGVKVLKFSVGFGTTLFKWTPKGSSTEFVLAAFPLGGYVKMLDEREAPVAPHERHLAFNTQPLRSRVAIVAAGPVANLLLAILLYAIVSWSGVDQPKAILASPISDSVAQKAGLVGGEQVKAAGFLGEDLAPVISFEDLRWLLTRGALEGRDVTIEVNSIPKGESRTVQLRLGALEAVDADAQLFRRIGIVSPLMRPVIGEVAADSAAFKAGLRMGDVVVTMGAVSIVDAQQLRELIRNSVENGRAIPTTWTIDRGDSRLELQVLADVKQEGNAKIGRLGAYLGAPPEMLNVRFGVLDGVWNGVLRTWQMSSLTVQMMGKMVTGQASLKNLSGPLTIADYAGKSASLGLTQYLIFLAIISVSLGVLNLLPLPVLDGGHLMYYLWEWVAGKPVTEVWMERLQRGGVAVLMVMMSIAFFNDISRLLT